MSTKTRNYEMRKPEITDEYWSTWSDNNINLDVIDAVLKNHQDAIDVAVQTATDAQAQANGAQWAESLFRVSGLTAEGDRAFASDPGYELTCSRRSTGGYAIYVTPPSSAGVTNRLLYASAQNVSGYNQIIGNSNSPDLTFTVQISQSTDLSEFSAVPSVGDTATAKRLIYLGSHITDKPVTPLLITASTAPAVISGIWVHAYDLVVTGVCETAGVWKLTKVGLYASSEAAIILPPTGEKYALVDVVHVTHAGSGTAFQTLYSVTKNASDPDISEGYLYFAYNPEGVILDYGMTGGDADSHTVRYSITADVTGDVDTYVAIYRDNRVTARMAKDTILTTEAL